MNRIVLHLLSGIATTFLGASLILIGNYKTPVEEVVSPYSTDQTVVSFVGLPPRLSAISNILGCLSLVVGGGYCGYKILEELDPALKQLAAPPMAIDGSFEVPTDTRKARPTAPQHQSQVSDEYQQAVRPPIYAEPESAELLPEINYNSATVAKVEIDDTKYPQPNAGLQPTVVPEGISILDAAAQTDLHLLFATKSGAGKTTTLLLLIYKINKFQEGKALFFLVDPKKRNWMGLEQIDNTYHTTDDLVVTSPAVVYPTGNNLQPAIDQIMVVLGILDSRIAQGDGVKFDNPVYLIIDEWFALRGALLYGDKKLYACVMQKLEWIVSMGREVGVHVVLVAVSHLVKDVGLSSAVRECFAVLCQGRMGQKNSVGYTPIVKAINDMFLIPLAEDVNRLRGELQDAKQKAAEQGDRPVIMSTMGSPIVGLVEHCPLIREMVIFEPSAQNESQISAQNESQVDEEALKLTHKFYEYTKNRDDNDFGTNGI